MKENLGKSDVETLMHRVLFAYQKATKDILGTGAAILLRPTLDILKKINEGAEEVNLIKGRNIDEVFEKLSKVMPATGLVKELRFEKLSPKRYVLHVDGCVWARHIHKKLKPKDMICPYALLAMSLFEEVLKAKVKVSYSEYHENGNKTRIESL